MRHAVLLLGLLGLASTGRASYFTEGGGFRQEDDLQGSLENIVDELQLLREVQLRDQQPLYDQEISVQMPDSQDYAFEANGPRVESLGQLLGQARPVQAEDAPLPLPPQARGAGGSEVGKTPQKKGQFEFVEFVEPHAKILKNVEVLEKRAPARRLERSGGLFNLFGNSSNVVFIAAVTMCCVVSVAGVVGGAYYFNTVRRRRAEMFDDFTRYSPAGPGRDILRKGRGFAGSPVAETGDESLAYKAQLHHYQQTKQKIIGDDGMRDDRSDKSDDEADDLEEHNFSVYECPGLAPTGDIEVQNPNFSQQP